MSHLVVVTNRREMEIPVTHLGGLYFAESDALAHSLFQTSDIVQWGREYVQALHWVRGDATWDVRHDSVVGTLLIDR